MNRIPARKWSLAGLFLGSLALFISIFHFTAGPFSTQPPTLENAVSEKVSVVKKGILAGLKGEKIPTSTEKSTIRIDSILDSFGIGLAIVALVLGFMGGVRKENGWSVSGTLFFGGCTLAFHAIMFSFGLILCIIVLAAVLSFFKGSLI